MGEATASVKPSATTFRAVEVPPMVKNILDSIPPAPAVALQILRLLDPEKTNMADLVRTIECDPALTSQLLRMCNSAMYAGSSEISSVQQAVLRLGFRIVAQIALGLVLNSHLNREQICYAGMTEDDFWRHSIESSLSSVYICQKMYRYEEHANEAFTAGLLHGIGKLVLARMPESYVKKMEGLCMDNGGDLVQAENQAFHTNHATVGANLMELWKLPEKIVFAVRFQHTPRADPFGVAPIIRIGSWVAASIEMGTDYEQARAHHYSTGLLVEDVGFDEQMFLDCKEKVGRQAEKLAASMS